MMSCSGRCTYPSDEFGVECVHGVELEVVDEVGGGVGEHDGHNNLVTPRRAHTRLVRLIHTYLQAQYRNR